MKKLLLILLALVFIIPMNINPVRADVYWTETFNSKKDAQSTSNASEYTFYIKDKYNQKHTFINYGVVYDDKENKYGLVLGYQCNASKKADTLRIEPCKLSNGTPVSDKRYNFDISKLTEGLIMIELPDWAAYEEKLHFVTTVIAKNAESSIYLKTKNHKYIPPIVVNSTNLIIDKGTKYDLGIKLALGGKPSIDTIDTTVAYCNPQGIIDAREAGTTYIRIQTPEQKILVVTVRVRDPKFPFYDVNPSMWYRKTVEDVYELGLLTGATETLFKPDSKMNRAMVACVFHRMEGRPQVTFKDYFDDVSSGEYYSIPVTWAKENGVINGYSDGTFKPLRNVSREEMVTMITNYAKYKGQYSDVTYDLSKFEDGSKVSPYARTSMQWGVTNSILSGKDNGRRLDPQGNATRAECSKMLLQTFNLFCYGI